MLKRLAVLLFAPLIGLLSVNAEEIVLQNGLNGYSGTTDCNFWHITSSDATASGILNYKNENDSYEKEYNSQPNGQALIIYHLSC